MQSPRRRRIRLPITLSVLLIVVNVILMVAWIVLLAQHNNWSGLTIGTVLFVLVLVGLGVYLFVTLKEIQLNQRQANFVDSVTHELKSPIASLQLSLETLQMRALAPAIRDEFYDLMHKDLERLDRLINQLLEVGRLDALVTEKPQEDVELDPLLRECATIACKLHKRPIGTVQFDMQPVRARGGRLALEMIFRNLLDNAVKYAADPPQVEIEVRALPKGRVAVRIADNGEGVPHDLRHKIFSLFFRGGHELKRTTKGTGVGLYIVHTLIQKLRGRVAVVDRGRKPGAIFEVVLPGSPMEPRPESPTEGACANAS